MNTTQVPPQQLRALAHRLGGPFDPDDLLHDTWVATTPGDAHSTGWWAVALRRRRLMTARSELRRRAREARAPLAQPRSPDEAGRDVLRNELRAALSEALATLGELDRRLLVDRYCLDLEPKDIAARRGLNPSTVRTRIARSLRRLQAYLDERDLGRDSWLGVLAVPSTPRVAPLPVVAGFGVAAALVAGCFAAAAIRKPSTARTPSPTTSRSPPVEPSPAPVAPATIPPVASAAVATLSVDRASELEVLRTRWERRRARFEATPSEPSETSEPSDDPPLLGPPEVGKLANLAAEYLGDCLGADYREPRKLSLRATVLAEPDIGAMVEDVVFDGPVPPQSALAECVEQTTYALFVEEASQSLRREIRIGIDLDAHTITTGVDLSLSEVLEFAVREPGLWTEVLESPEAMRELRDAYEGLEDALPPAELSAPK